MAGTARTSVAKRVATALPGLSKERIRRIGIMNLENKRKVQYNYWTGQPVAGGKQARKARQELILWIVGIAGLAVAAIAVITFR